MEVTSFSWDSKYLLPSVMGRATDTSIGYYFIHSFIEKDSTPSFSPT